MVSIITSDLTTLWPVLKSSVPCFSFFFFTKGHFMPVSSKNRVKKKKRRISLALKEMKWFILDWMCPAAWPDALAKLISVKCEKLAWVQRVKTANWLLISSSGKMINLTSKLQKILALSTEMKWLVRMDTFTLFSRSEVTDREQEKREEGAQVALFTNFFHNLALSFTFFSATQGI